jgi:hypothetical protein
MVESVQDQLKRLNLWDSEADEDWEGPEKLEALVRKFRQSWKDFHPDVYRRLVRAKDLEDTLQWAARQAVSNYWALRKVENSSLADLDAKRDLLDCQFGFRV